MEIVCCDLDGALCFSPNEFNYALSCFVTEIRKVDGRDYPPNTLREIVIMIQMFLNERGIYWKLLDQNSFQGLRNVLDNTMKQKTAMGLGVKISSSVISMEQEAKLFRLGILGEDTPTCLLQMIIYMLGLHLALHGGVEHCRLRRPGFNCQISVEVDNSGRERLVYREDPLQKNNQGGIGCRNNNKIVYVYEASEVTRCPLRLFKKYVRLLPPPKTVKKLYLRPRVNYTPSTWYCDQSYGNNKISTTVKDICSKAGFEGKFMNHSLHATSASRMFNNHVPEQVIKKVTGHRSDCVRNYKRTSDEIRKEASETISKGIESEVGETKCESHQESAKCESELIDNLLNEDQKKRLVKSLNACQMIKNVIKTRMEMHRHNKKNVTGVGKYVAKLLKKTKMRKNLKIQKQSDGSKITIDLNVNVTSK